MSTTIVCCVCNVLDIVELAGKAHNGLFYCSEHHPLKNGKWHGEFPKEKYNPDYHHVINVSGVTLE